MKTVRTRFAPSPTGYLHIGGVRTAIFAWLIAKQNGGTFILRIEDTDKVREVSGSEEHIMNSLRWLGINWDEGPDIGGSHGPYRQSERLSLYKEWANKLIELGRAYADPYSPSQLEELRTEAKQQKKPFLFREHRPENPPKWDGKQPLRFKSDPKTYKWQDEVMGELGAGPEAIDDFIIIKSDGYPTYNFAHIVDDHLMEITDIVRSQEFTASVPKFLNLYEAFKIEPPRIATVPYVMAADGKKKLSKRDKAKDILDYRNAGFLPEALLNYLVTLGWNDGTEQEIFTKEELIKKFKISRVQKDSAHFNEDRLIWLDGHYIRSTSLDDLFELAKPFWPKVADSYDDSYKKQVLSLVQDRLKFLEELAELTKFFFVDLPVQPKLIKQNPKLAKLDQTELVSLLKGSRDSLAQSNFEVEDLTDRLNQLLKSTNQKPAILFSLIRIATTQSPASPALADTLSCLGKEVSLRRIDQTIDSL